MRYVQTILLVLLLLIVPSLLAGAQDSITWGDEDFRFYERGDQNFSFSLGAKQPLFVLFPDNGEFFYLPEKLHTGWYGSIGWEMFLNNTLALGVELGYSSNTVVSSDKLAHVPMMFTTTWYPLISRINIPVSLKVGGLYTGIDDLGDQAYFGIIAAPSVEVLYHALDSWSFGLETSWWVTPELYTTAKSDQTGLGSFLTVVFTASFTNR